MAVSTQGLSTVGRRVFADIIQSAPLPGSAQTSSPPPRGKVTVSHSTQLRLEAKAVGNAVGLLKDRRKDAAVIRRAAEFSVKESDARLREARGSVSKWHLLARVCLSLAVWRVVGS